MGKRPGVMFYFDIRPALKRLSNGEQGQLFEAILDYGEYGREPALEGALGVAWDFIQPRLDRDKERYEEIARKRAQAARCRWEKEAEAEDDANAYTWMHRMPTTTTTSTPTSSSSSTPASASNPLLGRAAAAPRGAGEEAEHEFNRRRNAALARLDGAL